MAAITPQAQLYAILTGLAAGEYKTLKMMLFKNDYTPTPLTGIGDLTEADFGGYALMSALDFGAPFQNPDGYPEMDLPSQQWNSDGTAPSNNVYGYYVTTAGGDLLYAERFADAPIPMIDATNGIVVLSRFVLRNIGS
jgi:hypothetical protein